MHGAMKHDESYHVFTKKSGWPNVAGCRRITTTTTGQETVPGTCRYFKTDTKNKLLPHTLSRFLCFIHNYY